MVFHSKKKFIMLGIGQIKKLLNVGLDESFDRISTVCNKVVTLLLVQLG
jgi:hypothetical protein